MTASLLPTTPAAAHPVESAQLVGGGAECDRVRPLESAEPSRERAAVVLWRLVIRWPFTRRLLSLGALACAAAALGWAPAAAGTTWPAVMSSLGGISLWWLAVMSLAWAGAMLGYGVVMSASLPGLSGRGSLALNLAGSAVGNCVPLGGALSLGLTSAMARSWGFSTRAITAFLALTNVWNLLGRLLLGVAGAAWLLAAGAGSGSAPGTLGVLATVTIISGVVLGVVGALAVSEPLTHRLGRAIRRGPAAVALRQRVLDLGRREWGRLSLGMAANLVLLAVVLDAALRGLGGSPGLVAVVAVVGLERLITAIPLTPGGAGAAELVMVGALRVAGVGAAEAVAATLLYRIYTFVIEIPLGAAVALAWQATTGRRAASGAIPEIAASEANLDTAGAERS
ncbi:MAG: YbhN family protein [Actinomycetales bacterium]